jgi:hypothetical protein
MATDDPIRASDVDRDAVVATLREAYTAGRLTMEEFDERMAGAYAGKTWGDLRQLTIDLPTQPILGTDIPGRGLPHTVALPSHPPRPLPAAVPEPGDPADPAGEAGEAQPQRRRGGPIGILVPVAIWMLLVAHGTVGPGIVFVIIAVFTLTAIMSMIRRRP